MVNINDSRGNIAHNELDTRAIPESGGSDEGDGAIHDATRMGEDLSRD